MAKIHNVFKSLQFFALQNYLKNINKLNYAILR